MQVKVTEHEHRIGNLEVDVKNIQVENSVQNTQITELVKKIDKLIDNNNKWFYFAVTTIVGLLITMFISKIGL